MGFQYWYEGFIFILLFGSVIAVPCVAVTLLGTKMVNDLGNFPTKAAGIQTSTIWKLLIAEIIAGCLLLAFYRIFS